jgi:hypothetical protein
MEKISKRTLGSMIRKFYRLRKQAKEIETELETLKETFEELTDQQRVDILEGVTKTGKWFVFRSSRSRQVANVKEVLKVKPELVSTSYYHVWTVKPEKSEMK